MSNSKIVRVTMSAFALTRVLGSQCHDQASSQSIIVLSSEEVAELSITSVKPVKPIDATLAACNIGAAQDVPSKKAMRETDLRKADPVPQALLTLLPEHDSEKELRRKIQFQDARKWSNNKDYDRLGCSLLWAVGCVVFLTVALYVIRDGFWAVDWSWASLGVGSSTIVVMCALYAVVHWGFRKYERQNKPTGIAADPKSARITKLGIHSYKIMTLSAFFWGVLQHLRAPFDGAYADQAMDRYNGDFTNSGMAEKYEAHDAWVDWKEESGLMDADVATFVVIFSVSAAIFITAVVLQYCHYQNKIKCWKAGVPLEQ